MNLTQRPTIDLRYTAWKRERSGLTIYGTWCLTPEGDYDPALVVVRTGDERSDHCVPVIVPMAEMWLFGTEVDDLFLDGHPYGIPSDHVAAGLIACTMAARACEQLRMEPSSRSINAFGELMADNIGDVFAMGRAPAELLMGDGMSVGEIVATTSEGVEQSEVIRV